MSDAADFGRALLEVEVKRRAAASGVPADVVRGYLEAEVRQHPFRITYDPNVAYPLLMEVRLVGEQFHLVMNLSHPWVLHGMLGKSTTPEQRAMLEVVMFCIASPHRRTEEERKVWSAEFARVGRYLWDASAVLYANDNAIFAEEDA